MLSTIILSSDKEHQKSNAELREKLIKLCKDRELPFGIIVRKAMNQNILFTTIFRLSYGNYPVNRGEVSMTLLEISKVYPDGHEELIRGTEASGFTVQSFKDILFLGNKPYAMNYLAPAVISPYISGGSQYLGSSVIVPDLLFEDGEIKPIEDDFPKLPILANPLKK